jgi:simple sugar transport system ATP-binding protein
MADGAPLALKLSAIAKSFGPVRANRDASLAVQVGEIHALVGENGAGKSTLMRILSGMYAPDAGTVEVDGRDVTGWSTAQAIAAGVGMVHQHFMLVPTLTVAENVVLGREPVSGGVLDRAAAVHEVERVSRETGLEVNASRRVADLSVGEAQRVEIIKTLLRGARILVLDEPTAVLSPPEVRDLWRVLRGLRDQGGTVVLITHKLDEVVSVSDAITVMRAGATVARMPTAGTTPAAIARAMVGRDVVLAGDEAAALGAVHVAGNAAPGDGSLGDGSLGGPPPPGRYRRPLATPAPPRRRADRSPARLVRPAWSRHAPPGPPHSRWTTSWSPGRARRGRWTGCRSPSPRARSSASPGSRGTDRPSSWRRSRGSGGRRAGGSGSTRST